MNKYRHFNLCSSSFEAVSQCYGGRNRSTCRNLTGQMLKMTLQTNNLHIFLCRQRVYNAITERKKGKECEKLGDTKKIIRSVNRRTGNNNNGQNKKDKITQHEPIKHRG